MNTFNVSKRRIRLVGTSLSEVLVQGDHNAEECRFVFSSEHNYLMGQGFTYKLVYYRSDAAGRDVTLTRVSGTEALTLSWNPDRYATAVSGPFAFTLTAYKDDLSFCWNSDPFTLQVMNAISPAVSVDPDELGVSVQTMYANLAARVYTLEHATLDEIDRGYYYNSAFYEDAAHIRQTTPDTEKLYIDIPTGGLYTYFSGSYHSASIDLSNYYSKAQIDASLDTKADASMVYSKTASDNRFVAKSESKNYTQEEKEKLADLPDASSLESQIGSRYTKPQAGIPKTDLASGVQTSLDKADTALQEHQDISGKQDIVSDLEEIRQGAALGSTAIQEHQSLAAYSLTSETGYRVELEMNDETYVITPKVYDKNGNLVSTGESIDLPLESVVVGATYSSQNKKIVLLLKNGTTVDVPVSALISGLVTESYFNTTVENLQQKALVTTLENADDTHYPSTKVVSELKGDIDGKADAEHQHDISDVTGLNTALGSKVDTVTLNDRLGVSLSLTSDGLLHIEEVTI